MSLVDQILDSALDGSSSLTDAIRRCKVLASRIDDQELAGWVDNELNGYEKIEDVPVYRRANATLKANASNIAWSTRGQDIPVYLLPEELWDAASYVYFMQGVAALEMNCQRDDVVFEAPSTIRHWIETEGKGNMTVSALYLEPPPGSAADVLSSIRNAVVESILRIERSFPSLQDEQIRNDQKIQEFVSEAFHISIRGDNAVVSIGDSANIQQDNRRVKVKDLDSLHNYLKLEGFAESDMAALDTLLEDGVAVEELKSGRGKIVDWAGESAKKLGPKVGGDIYKAGVTLAIKAVATYLGIPT